MSNRKRAKATNGKLVRQQLKRYRRGAQRIQAERRMREGLPGNSEAIDIDAVRETMRTVEERGTTPRIEDRS